MARNQMLPIAIQFVPPAVDSFGDIVELIDSVGDMAAWEGYLAGSTLLDA